MIKSLRIPLREAVTIARARANLDFDSSRSLDYQKFVLELGAAGLKVTRVKRCDRREVCLCLKFNKLRGHFRARARARV